MYDDYIGRQIRRATRSLLVLSFVPVLAAAAAAISYQRFLGSLLHGPMQMSAQELVAVSNPESLSRYNVVVNGDQIFSTGFQKLAEGESSGGKDVSNKKVAERISVLTFGDRQLLVVSEDRPTSTQLRGALEAISPEIRTQVLSKLIVENPGSASAYLPMMLDTREFTADAWTIPVAGIAAVLLGAWGIFVCMRWQSNPETHPIHQGLRKYGDPRLIRGRIDGEARAENAKDSGAAITANWFLHAWPFGLRVRPLADIAWAYKLVITHRVNFVPTGKTHHAKVFDRQGKAIQFQDKEPAVDALLLKLSQRAPWVVMGFSGPIENMFKKQRAQFLAEVDKRKAAAKAAPSEAPKLQPQTKKPQPVGVA